MNELRGIYTIWYRDLLRFWHDKMRMVSAITFPLLFLVVFGGGLSARVGALATDVDFSQFMFPGIIGMTVLMTSFMFGVSVVWDREFGFLKEVLVAPINRVSVSIGKTLGAATVAMLQGSVVLVLAPFIGVSLSLSTVLLLLPLMFLMAAAMGSFGVVLATRIRSMEAFQAVMQMLMFPIIFLSGVFFPVSGLPSWMNVIVKMNPATYGVASIRQVVLGTEAGAAFRIVLLGREMSLLDTVGVLAAFGLVMVLLAMWSFEHQE